MNTFELNISANEEMLDDTEQNKDGIIRGSSGSNDAYYWEFDPTTETLTFFGWNVETYTCKEIENQVKHMVFSDSVHDVYLPGSSVNFPNLEDVYISKNVSGFSLSVLGKGGRLKEYIVDSKNQYYKSIDGNLYFYGGSQNSLYLQGYATAKEDETLEVPYNTRMIYDGALAGSKNLKALILSERTIEFNIPLYQADTIVHVIVPNKECTFVYDTNRKVNPDLTLYSWTDANIKRQCDAYNLNFKEIPLDNIRSIDVIENPAVMTVMKGHTYSLEGLKLKAELTDGSTRTITSGYTVTGLDTSKVGMNTLTIQLGKAKTTLDIEVVEIPQDVYLPTDKKLNISLSWDKTYYEYNQVCYFEPEESGLYSIFTEGLYDTYLQVENNSGFSKSNDNGGASENAQLDVYLKKGIVYTITVSASKKIQCDLVAKLISTKADDGVVVSGSVKNTYNDVADYITFNYEVKGLADEQKLYYTYEPGMLEKNVDGVWQEVPVKADYDAGEFKNIEMTKTATIQICPGKIYENLTTAQYRYTHQIGGKKVAVKFYLYNIESEDSENVLIKNKTKNVHYTTKETEKIYYIRADVTGDYIFYTTGDYNTSAIIRKIDNTYCASDANSGENNNFKVSLNAIKGVTYKVIVSVKDLKEDADFHLIVEAKCVHNYTKTTTEPTCISKGYTTYTCSLCEDSYVDDYTEAVGHNYTVKITPPTCTQAGREHGTCTRCDDEYDKEIKALGHDYEQLIIKATEHQKGYIIKRCKRCNTSDIIEENGPLKKWIPPTIKKLKVKKKTLTVTWNRKKQISGYEIQISKNKKFKKVLRKNVKASINKITFKKLKSKTKYYVRIRTYCVIDGKKTYSKWSRVKSKIVK